jgi:hypothetical protein
LPNGNRGEALTVVQHALPQSLFSNFLALISDPPGCFKKTQSNRLYIAVVGAKISAMSALR